MRRVLTLAFTLILIVGCASIGSKVALVIDAGSQWEIKHAGSGDSYKFTCEKIHIEVNEIVLTEQTSAYGPIIPFIPSTYHHSYENFNLFLNMKITVWPKSGVTNADGSLVMATSSKQTIPLIDSRISKVSESTDNETKELRAQYFMTFTYDKKLSELNNLELQFQLPMSQCPIPNLSLSKKKISDNEFTISPGV
jgi:hypothetical protein